MREGVTMQQKEYVNKSKEPSSKLHKLHGVKNTTIYNPLNMLSNDFTCTKASLSINISGGTHAKRSLTIGIRISVKFIHFGCH